MRFEPAADGTVLVDELSLRVPMRFGGNATEELVVKPRLLSALRFREAALSTTIQSIPGGETHIGYA